MELLSEEEQWENLKNWLRTSGPQVLILAALALLGWFGWKWWQGRGDEQALAASALYEKVIAGFDDNKNADSLALIESLRTEYPKSPYVAAADLVAARVFVESNQLDKAADRLQRVANSAADEKLRPVAKIRLARVQSAQGQYDAALATLGTADLGVHEPARREARGDVLFAKGDKAGALAEYQAARKLLPATAGGGDDQSVGALLDLKIADLQGGVVAPAAAASATPATVPAPTPAPAATPAQPAAKP